MFRTVRLESKKELFLKTNNPNNFLRSTRRKEKPITDKITNMTFNKDYHPTKIEVSSRQKYLNNISQNSLKPYNDKSNTKKLSKIRRSRNIGDNNSIFNDNSSISKSYSSRSLNFRTLSNYKRSKTEYKVKRSKSFFCNRTNDKENILKTTNNSRIRKLYSMASDIFNLDECSTNLVQNSSTYNNNIFNTDNSIDNNIHLGNEKNHAIKNLKYYTIDNDNNNSNNIFNGKNKTNNTNMNSSKGLLERGNCEFSIEKARSINIKRMKKLEKNIDNKKYNKLSLLLNKDFANSDFVPFLHKMNKKTNASNIESVNYDIISNKSNNLYDKYNKLSNKKSTFSEYENYEIIVPKNYNKLDGSKLKNLLHAQGVHFYAFREQANVQGDKGKFKFRVRKTNIDNTGNNNNKIQKLSKKLSNLFNVKLKKYDEINEKKTSEITKEYGPEVVSNHLQTEENKSKQIKR